MVKISAIVIINNKINNKNLKCRRQTSSFFLSSILTVGINAALNVPSANNRSNVLGNPNVTKKASANIDAQGILQLIYLANNLKFY